MNNVNYDDPKIEEQWCEARRQQVIEYLKTQGVKHGEVGEWPAWHLAPYVSIWAIESLANPGWVGWWVICGDSPTDYVSADVIKHPREAMKAFAKQWDEVASYMERGEPHPDTSIGPPEKWSELAPLLKSRAKTLRDWANNDEVWAYLEDDE